MNVSSFAHRALYEGGDKIALMLCVGEEFLFWFYCGSGRGERNNLILVCFLYHVRVAFPVSS